MNKAEEILSARGVKLTAVRILVLKNLLEHKKAKSLKDIEQELAYTDRSSIFRSLKKFEENKIVHSIDDGSGMVKYAVCPEDCSCELKDLHFHFYCTKCSLTHCLYNNPVPEIQLPENFTLQQANMVVKGLCNTCC